MKSEDNQEEIDKTTDEAEEPNPEDNHNSWTTLATSSHVNSINVSPYLDFSIGDITTQRTFPAPRSDSDIRRGTSSIKSCSFNPLASTSAKTSVDCSHVFLETLSIKLQVITVFTRKYLPE